MVGAQPSFSLISVLSELRPRTPSGPGMCWIGSFLFSKLRTISAISFMLTISSLPIFTGSRKSDFVNLDHGIEKFMTVNSKIPNQRQKFNTCEICLITYNLNTFRDFQVKFNTLEIGLQISEVSIAGHNNLQDNFPWDESSTLHKEVSILHKIQMPF